MAIPIRALKALGRGRSAALGMVTTALLATGAGVGIFLGIRVLAKNFKKGVRERQALRPGSPAGFASQLKLAFENDNAFGWGTDEAAIYNTIETIPNAATFNKVQAAYRDLYGKNLSAELQNELSSQEYAVLLELINAKF